MIYLKFLLHVTYIYVEIFNLFIHYTLSWIINIRVRAGQRNHTMDH